GLIVDAIHDTEEIVVKPLSAQLKEIRIYAGATIMGDGGVALILDVLGLAQQAHVLSESRNRTPTHDAVSVAAVTKNQQAFLIVRLGNRRLALPMGTVSRLEEMPRAAVEFADGQEVVQYRGEILAL